jgi:hypothetical protein
LEVRVLPAPPRSLAQTEISRLFANGPELAGIDARIFVPAKGVVPVGRPMRSHRRDSALEAS